MTILNENGRGVKKINQFKQKKKNLQLKIREENVQYLFKETSEANKNNL